MIQWRSGRIAPFLGLALALALTVTPASAHKGEHHAEPPAAAAPAQPGDAAATTPASGASPNAPTEMSWPTGDDGGMKMVHRQTPTTTEGRMVAWMGAWHPAVIHFPIALLLTVAFLELAAAIRRKPLYNASNKILLAVAVLGAFAAAPLGWADAGMPTPEDGWALTWHRWIGTTIPFLMFLLWYLKRPAEQAAVRPSSRRYEIVLAVSVIVVLVQAYLGGEITHGANHMAF